MWGFINNLSVPLTSRWGHLVSLPEQVSLKELCGKQQLVSLLSLNFSYGQTHRQTPSSNSETQNTFPQQRSEQPCSPRRRARCLLAHRIADLKNWNMMLKISVVLFSSRVNSFNAAAPCNWENFSKGLLLYRKIDCNSILTKTNPVYFHIDHQREKHTM